MTVIPRFTRRSRMVRRIIILARELERLDPAYRRPRLGELTPLAIPEDADVERYGKRLARRVERAIEEYQKHGT